MLKDEKTLDEFGGFKNNFDAEEIDFFGDKVMVDKKGEVVETLESQKPPKKEKPQGNDNPDDPDPEDKGDEPLKDIDDNLDFNSEEDKLLALKKQQGNLPKGEVEKSSESSVIATVKTLKERGLLEYELEENTELTEDIAEQILEDNFDDRVETRIEELVGSLPPIIKDLNKFVLSGGDPREFFDALTTQSSGVLTENLDLTKTENQELVIRTKLKEEGYDKDYIDTHLQFLKDSGKLEHFAKTDYKKWMDKKSKAHEELVQQQREQKETYKEYRRELKTKVKSFLDGQEAVGGFKITPGDRNILPAYMVDETVPTKSGKNITKMYHDLNKALEDENKAIVLAKLLINDFDLSKFTKEAETAISKRVKDGIQRNSTVPSRSVGSSQKKSLADYY